MHKLQKKKNVFPGEKEKTKTSTLRDQQDSDNTLMPEYKFVSLKLPKYDTDLKVKMKIK